VEDSVGVFILNHNLRLSAPDAGIDAPITVDPVEKRAALSDANRFVPVMVESTVSNAEAAMVLPGWVNIACNTATSSAVAVPVDQVVPSVSALNIHRAAVFPVLVTVAGVPAAVVKPNPTVLKS